MKRQPQIESNGTRSIAGSDERGFAIVIVLLVIVVMIFLGTGFLFMGATENRIAENERLSMQALYAAETGTRVVQTWFDRPMSSANLVNPPLAVIDRSLRLIDADGDPATPPVAADGTTAAPYYKQGVDLDADGNDDVFDKPYRDALVDTLLGTEAGPDMRIDETASTAARNFLVALSSALFADYPGRGLQARVNLIDIYAPPYVQTGGGWVRHGMATVKIVAGVYLQQAGAAEKKIGERMVKVVLNEIPYNPGEALGPLHSCDTLTWDGEFTVFWGVTTSVNAADLHDNHDKLAVSLPRAPTPGHAGAAPSIGPRVDVLWGYHSDADFLAYKAMIEGLPIQDPWMRVIVGGPLAEATSGAAQPWPFTWIPGFPFEDGDLPYHDWGQGPNPYPSNWDGCHSNVFQLTPVDCPSFDYHLWKLIAQAGANAHYYAWHNGDEFREDGVGTARSFREITDQQTGLFFFDTTDGIAPHDDDGDGEYDNLTPMIKISGGRWGVRGMVYLNALSFQGKGVTGRTVQFRAPGEPFQDINTNGRWDFGENWINLDYPDDLDDQFDADAGDSLQDDGSHGGLAVRNKRGPVIEDEAILWGILYTNGYYDSTGNGTYYGTVISKQGIGETSPSAGTPEHYWDESLEDDFPPGDWGLPRVTITRWETDI
jgi:hypothetical protein